MTTVQQIIEGAWNSYSANDPGKLAQDPELIAHLNRVYQRTWPLIARARPDEFQSETTVVLGGSPPFATLPADVIDVLQVYTSAGARVNLVPSTDRTRTWQLPPCVYRRGMTLVSRFAALDPVAGHVLTLTVLDAPAALTALGSSLDARWPVRHVQLFVNELAVYLAVKDAGRDENDRGAAIAALQGSAGALAAEFGLPPEAVQWIHADVERDAKAPA